MDEWDVLRQLVLSFLLLLDRGHDGPPFIDFILHIVHGLRRRETPERFIASLQKLFTKGFVRSSIIEVGVLVGA